ncbi:MAG: hypothetical protein JW927_22180 [Deltaproteobacteria bacterium]|nr:hypothetical protein [Deltaproteobacteria bacterium]
MNELPGIINNTLVTTQNIIALLEEISVENEPTFIKLGENLQKIYSDAKGLTELTREIAMLLDGSSKDNILGNIGTFTRISLSRLNTCREDVINILPKVETYSTNLKRLNDMIPVIKNIAKKLNIVALHIAIETSRNRESEEMFSFFVQEIRKLADRVNAISVKIREEAENEKSKQISDSNSFTEKKDRINTLADHAHHSVEENISEIENLVTISLNAMRNAETRSKKLYSLVGEIVVAIQFHDITRQQIEHVIQSLGEIEPLLKADKNNETAFSENQGNNLVKAYTLFTLQTEQITQVIKEINSSYKKIRQSFIEIDNVIQGLVNEMIDLCQNTEHSGSDINPFQKLTTGLNNLDKIMSQGKEIAEMIDSNLKQSAETAQHMAGQLNQMNDISSDLHIKAINALIMSKRLGSNGKTLSVLAEDVTEVSLESNEFVLDVVEILKAIEDLSSNLSGVSIQEEAGNDNSSIEANPSSGIDMIADVYADYLAKSKLSIERSKDLKNKIVLLESDINFFNKIEDSLTYQKDMIAQMMKSIRPFITEEGLANDELEHLRNRYTMEIERGIHEKALGKNKSLQYDTRESQREKTGSTEADDADYIADNVELF